MRALATERIFPVVFKSQTQFNASLSALAANCPAVDRSAQVSYVSSMGEELNSAIAALNQLEKVIKTIETPGLIEGEEAQSYFCRDDILPAMAELRKHVDRLEGMVDFREWPLPSYSAMFFNQS